MRSVVGGLLNWLVRNFLLLVLITAVLAGSSVLLKSYRGYTDARKHFSENQEWVKNAPNIWQAIIERYSNQLDKFRAQGFSAAQRKIGSEREKKEYERNNIPKISLSANDYQKRIELSLEIAALDQLSNYLKAKAADGEKLYQNWVQAYEKYKTEKDSPNKSTYERVTHRKVNELAIKSDAARDEYFKYFDSARSGFSFSSNHYDETVNHIKDEIHQAENSAWIYLEEESDNKLGIAISILIVIIVSPLLIKALFYYLFAPLASRCHPICLLPNSSGQISDSNYVELKKAESTISAVSQSLKVKNDEELLILPEYLQSADFNANKQTQLLLNPQFPFTCLLAGMALLTRISPNRPETITVSSANDPLNEIGVISISPGSAVIFQPQNLVGIIYPKDRPVKITKHWRINSLHAWLTLQLRYIVFHGPARLIVKGCRGVRVAPCGSDRVLNQNVTLGFTGNVEYSTSRCETFISYIMGENELLNDRFGGQNGFFIYEEIPSSKKKGGITGRGLEGVTDAVLKAFGI